METMVLVDPQSGHDVRIARLQLAQYCGICGADMRGDWGMSVDDGRGWTCLSHERRLMSLGMTDERRARERMRQSLTGARSGDVTTVTRELLLAVGL